MVNAKPKNVDETVSFLKSLRHKDGSYDSVKVAFYVAVLSGLLDSAWGSFHRSTIVRFFVHGNTVRIGVGEGSIREWEIEALKASPVRHEWFRIGQLDTASVPGIKYVPGEKVSGMPRELIPVKIPNVYFFVSNQSV